MWKKMLNYSADTELTSKKAAVGSSKDQPTQPNPNRVAAGRRNRAKRGELTEAGRDRLRKAAIAHRPWRFASGPKTDAGKARAAQNGKARQSGPKSVREVRDELSEIRDLLREMKSTRGEVETF